MSISVRRVWRVRGCREWEGGCIRWPWVAGGGVAGSVIIYGNGWTRLAGSASSTVTLWVWAWRRVAVWGEWVWVGIQGRLQLRKV